MKKLSIIIDDEKRAPSPPLGGPRRLQTWEQSSTKLLTPDIVDTLPETNSKSTSKLMVGRLLSFWDGLF